MHATLIPPDAAIDAAVPAGDAARIPAAAPALGARHDVAGTPPSREVLSFRLGGEEYCIDILTVQEIRGYSEPTRIANAPPYIKGVLNLRGTIVPIADLRSKFGVEPVRYDSLTVTIVLTLGRSVVGVVVDAVSDVIELQAQEIKPAPYFSGAIDARHITGLATCRDGERERMLILLDIAQLMAAQDIGLVAADAN